MSPRTTRTTSPQPSVSIRNAASPGARRPRSPTPSTVARLSTPPSDSSTVEECAFTRGAPTSCLSTARRPGSALRDLVDLRPGLGQVVVGQLGEVDVLGQRLAV